MVLRRVLLRDWEAVLTHPAFGEGQRAYQRGDSPSSPYEIASLADVSFCRGWRAARSKDPAPRKLVFVADDGGVP